MARLSWLRRARLKVLPEEAGTHFLAVLPVVLIAAMLCAFSFRMVTTMTLQATPSIILPPAKVLATVSKQEPRLEIHVHEATLDRPTEIDVRGVRYANVVAAVDAIQQMLETEPGLRLFVRADKGVGFRLIKTFLHELNLIHAPPITFSVLDREAPAVP